MFEINVTVNAPELAEALNNLAAALKGAKLEPAASKTGKADKTAPVPLRTICRLLIPHRLLPHPRPQ